MARNPIKYPYASGTTNKIYPVTKSEIEAGIALKADIRSNDPNGIANFEQTAIRDLQTAGALYDNEQIYNVGDYVSVLISEGAITRILYFRCKQANTTQKPPITGTNGGTTDRHVLSEPVFANPNSWERVLFETRNLATFSTISDRNIVLIGDASKNNVFGTLNVKLKGSGSSSYDCVFDIEFFGRATEFRIKNVYYSENIRNSNNLCDGVQIGHPGFFIEINQGKMYLAVKNHKYCQDMEFDFSKLNCIVIPSTSAYSIAKPYAIIENGGVIREGLGNVIPNHRNNANAQSDETYDFYCFINGVTPWISAMTLSATYYHQWANGGFASLNIDIADKVLANVGSINGSSSGVLRNQELPNIKGESGSWTRFSGEGDFDWGIDSAFQTPGNTNKGNFWEGCLDFSKRDVKQIYGKQSVYIAHRGGGGDFDNFFVGFSIDASRSNSIYNGSSVQMNRGVEVFLMRTF